MSGLPSRYIPHTDDDVRAMLDAVGVASVEALFESIPEKLRLARPLAIPRAASEQEIVAIMAMPTVHRKVWLQSQCTEGLTRLGCEPRLTKEQQILYKIIR